jgi:hypothetical protein
MDTETDGEGQGRRVFFVGFWPDYERHTFAAPPAAGWQWLTVDLRETIEPRGPFRRQRRRLRLRRYGRSLQAAMTQRPRDVYFFQDHGDVLDMVGQLSTPFYGGILLRNPVGADAQRIAQLRLLLARRVRIWSFDAGDCARYGFEPYLQFLRKAAHDEVAISVDLFFLGRDKGRAAVLEAIRRNAESAGYTTDIEIVRDGSKSTPYAAYLARLQRARCIIDINQDRQSGLTLRPLEAIFYRKKLMTNNRSVLEMPGYRPQNVMLIDDAPAPEQIAAFLQSAFVPVDAADLRRNDAGEVMRQLAEAAVQRPSHGA